MTLYKFRSLQNQKDYDRIIDIIENGFYCNDFLGFNDMNEGVYINNKDNTYITFSEKQKYKICSFSGVKALNSELMWGHYANTGRGVAIEINVEDSSNIREINYNTNDNLNTMEKILTNKSKEWVHEDEYRYLSTNNLPNNKVSIGTITKIYFGTPYEALTNYEKIRMKHDKLKEYYKFKDTLKKACITKDILCEDFKFNV
ncbi:DUF2971 domain-containing protein [Malaciobacter canalis]|uniref:DUF2971 domain-containing protein n=1 Tax=Malaciobacter canalis TaxID=1912871 RepID=UPI00384C4963